MKLIGRSKFKDGNRKRSKEVEKSRKEKRKEQRKRKKIARATYFQEKGKSRVKCADKYHSVQSDEISSEKSGERKDVVDGIAKLQNKKRQLEFERNRAKKTSLKEANVKENILIKKLEKQLKLNKRKKKDTIPKSFIEDGLDYLLDFCLEKDRDRIVDTEKELLKDKSDVEFQNDLSIVAEGNSANDKDIKGNVPCTMGSSLHDDDLTGSSSMQKFDQNADSSDSWTLSPDDGVKETMEVNSLAVLGEERNGNDTWEDIYGRKRDKAGNVVRSTGRYVPPATRTVTNEEDADEKIISLRKRIKGCLNRVAEFNIHSIANQIDEMYMSNSRNDMNNILSKLTIEALVSPVLTPDRLVCEHMMLIAILHANVGTEVGAHFLEVLAKNLNEMLATPPKVENKELDNIVLMFSHLYNFKVYGHKLLYQILERLSSKFTEKEIELILLVLKTAGFPLRKDDPIALKEFVQNLQRKASGEKRESSRVNFMLDVLLAIKNNNVNKVSSQYDPSYVEHLKKIAKSVIRKGNAVTRLNVSLEDLLEAEKRGKWWIIGSAWSSMKDASNELNVEKKETVELIFEQKILDLAQKQRMNTITRKNIFCILMTAEDYMDAFEKFHHLGLKDQQQREVIYVLMHCCLHESKFNPYYAILAQKLCECERKYQLTIQYALWDKLKILETYDTKQLTNLAKFLTHLFVENSVAFSILKVIDFTELDKHTMKLLRQIILGILLHKNEETCLRVFERIAISPHLQNFRESLRLFINHFLLKNITGNIAPTEKELTLKERAELAEKILTYRGSKVAF